jgi:predicted ATP-grasp superfamily ATP-dependent carboligase
MNIDMGTFSLGMKHPSSGRKGTSSPMGHQAAAPLAGDSPVVVIVGASARAMARSAAAAGWTVHAADLFADRDLRDVARACVRVGDGDAPYPGSLATAVRRFPHGPWLYTGAVENHPHLIDAITAERPLAGNAGGRVSLVRDPFQLAVAVREAGLVFPDTHHGPGGVPVDGSYLVKPMASAGGRGIARWRGGTTDDGTPRVWQRHVAGRGVSAAFVCRPHGARLLGLVEQEIGLPWCHAAPFAFCGASRGSFAARLDGITDEIVEQAARLGRLLVGRFGLVGLVGVDAVIDGQGRLCVIEVNPRPTASMELHERATGESLAAAHLAACGWNVATPPASTQPPRDCCWAKAVLHAPHDFAATERLVAAWDELAAPWSDADGGWSAIADIPMPTQTIRRGAAWITAFASASTPAAARAELQRRAAALAATVSPPSAAAVPPPAGRGTA